MNPPLNTATALPAGNARFPVWLRLFEPAPAIPITQTDPTALRASYGRWRWRVLVWSIIGYAIFYFVRNNLPIAMPVIEKTLRISKSQLGLFLTLNGVLYGISKLANGFFGDRCNARSFMFVGLLGSVALNLIFWFRSTFAFFGLL